MSAVSRSRIVVMSATCRATCACSTASVRSTSLVSTFFCFSMSRRAIASSCSSLNSAISRSRAARTLATFDFCSASNSAPSRSKSSVFFRVVTFLATICCWLSCSISFRSTLACCVICAIFRRPCASKTLRSCSCVGSVWSSELIVTDSSVRPLLARSCVTICWTLLANSSRLLWSSCSSFVAATVRSALTSFSCTSSLTASACTLRSPSDRAACRMSSALAWTLM